MLVLGGSCGAESSERTVLVLLVATTWYDDVEAIPPADHGRRWLAAHSGPGVDSPRQPRPHGLLEEASAPGGEGEQGGTPSSRNSGISQRPPPAAGGGR